ncbi:MAG: hypothetical protein Kow002_13370 [Anaerolineales bacterium]
MTYSLTPASEYPVSELAALFTDSFKDYFVPVKFNEQALLEIVRRDSVDLSVSKVMLSEEKPVGIALIARRGWENRVAAMGLIPEMRGKGAGSWMMEQLIDQAKARGTKRLCLEVIEANHPAVHIYEQKGFAKTRKLIGFVGKIEAEAANDPLEEIDLRAMGKIVALHGLDDLPWQISGETLAVFSGPSLAFKFGPAYAVISNPNAEHVVIWSLLVMPEARRQGQAEVMLRALSSRYKDKVWHVPPLCPEEAAHPFRKIGLEEDKIAQWQMSLSLV